MTSDLLKALKAILPYAENEVSSLFELGRDDPDTLCYAQLAEQEIVQARNAIAKAEQVTT
jgi:hypothetical protein